MAYTSGESAAPYDNYDVTSHLLFDSGICVVPVSPNADGSPNPPQLVKTKSVICRKVIRWSVTRNGSMPDLPDPTPRDENLTLLSAEIAAMNPAIVDENNRAYTLSGVYTYVFGTPPWSVPPGKDRKPQYFTVGTTPASDRGEGSDTVYPANFIQGIIPN